MGPSLSHFTRTSAVTKPRQLAPTVGLVHGGVAFSKGALPGFGSYADSLMTKSHRGKYYIDNSQWGPEADSIESGYRATFGEIHVFIGKFGAPVLEPDIFTDTVETAGTPILPSIR
ncbi:hypothetical protein ZWY2020_003794 [Hordeum vulgare]|nr:hypothetical protein ZWY2020_003794 [Hordeum vulgare]